jgi:parallel beta-helix repeat protein
MLAGALPVASKPAGRAGCVRWAHPAGNDRAVGSPTAPLRTITRLAATLAPGQMGCLAPGVVYREAVQIPHGGTPGRPIRIRTGGSPRATIWGGIWVRPGSNDVVVGGVKVRGLGERRPATVLVQADRFTLLRSDVSGRDIVRPTPCLLVNSGTGTVLDGNKFHQCTRVIRRNVYVPGVHLWNASQSTIVNNEITRTAGDGIVLSPNARHTLVAHNHLHGNVGGILLGGDGRTASSDNLVVDNIVAYSGGANVHASFPPPARGHENLVTGNCLWKGFGGNIVRGAGFTAIANLIRNPRYVNRFRGLALRPGPCRSKQPNTRRTAARSVGTPFPVMAPFVVHYRLRALGGSVQVVRLSLTRVLPHARVEVECVRGCRIVERHVAADSGKTATTRLRGRWLPRGAVVAIRVRKFGWAGAFARVRVIGLPRGVRIGHACLPPGARRPVSCAGFARR